MKDHKQRIGFVLLHGEDTRDELVDRVSDIIGKMAHDEGFECMVSSASNDQYDHYDSECE